MLGRFVKKEKGVSGVVTTLLIVVLTVVLVASAYSYVVMNLPRTSPAQLSNMSPTLSYADAGGGYAYLVINVVNKYGSALPAFSTSFNVVVNGPVSFASSHIISQFISTSYFSPGQNFTYNSKMDNQKVPVSAEGSLQVIIAFIDDNAKKLIWYSELAGPALSGGLQLVSSQPATVTVGSPVTLTVLPSGGDPPYTYSWSASGPGAYWFTSTNTQTTTFYPGQAGNYNVTASVVDSFYAFSSSYIQYASSSVPPNRVSLSVPITVVQSASPAVISPYLLVLANVTSCSSSVTGTDSPVVPSVSPAVRIAPDAQQYAVTFYLWVDTASGLMGYGTFVNTHNVFTTTVTINFAGQSQGTAGADSLTFFVPPGIYSFTVSFSGWLHEVYAVLPVPQSGTIVVSNSDVSQNIILYTQSGGDGKLQDNAVGAYLNLTSTDGNIAINLPTPQLGNAGQSSIYTLPNYVFTETSTYVKGGTIFYNVTYNINIPLLKSGYYNIAMLWFSTDAVNIFSSYDSGSYFSVINTQDYQTSAKYPANPYNTFTYMGWSGALSNVYLSPGTNVIVSALGLYHTVINYEIYFKIYMFVSTQLIPVTFQPYTINNGVTDYYLPSDVQWSVSLTGGSGQTYTGSASGHNSITISVPPGVYNVSVPAVSYSPGISFSFDSSRSSFSNSINVGTYPLPETAAFDKDINLQVQLNPIGAGRVTSSDGKISTTASQSVVYVVPGYWDSSGNDYHSYPGITLSVSSASGYTFSNWTTNNTNYPSSTSTSYSFTLKTALTVNANFVGQVNIWVVPSSANSNIFSTFSWHIWDKNNNQNYQELSNYTVLISFSRSAIGTTQYLEIFPYVSWSKYPGQPAYYYIATHATVNNGNINIVSQGSDRYQNYYLNITVNSGGVISLNWDSYYQVTAQASGPGTASVSVSGTSLQYAGGSTYTFYKYGSTVTLTATPNSGATFLNWSFTPTGGATQWSVYTTQDPPSFSLTQAGIYTAYFSSSPTVTFTEQNINYYSGNWRVIYNGISYISAVPNSITVQLTSTGTITFTISQLPLDSIPQNGVVNAANSVKSLSSSITVSGITQSTSGALTVTLSVSGSGTVQVNFVQYYLVSAIANPSNGGTVNSPPFGVSQGSSPNYNYIIISNLFTNFYYFLPTAQVNLQVTQVNSGYQFVNWSVHLPSGKTLWGVSTSKSFTFYPGINMYGYFYAIFLGSGNIVFVPSNLPNTVWTVKYNNVNYTSSGSGTNSISIDAATGTDTFTVYPAPYTYSVFVAQKAAGTGVTYSSNGNQLTITVNVQGSVTVTVYFTGYYEVLVTPMNVQVTPDPTQTPIYPSNYTKYNGIYYYSNNTLVSNSLTSTKIVGWYVKALLPFSNATLSSSLGTTTKLVRLIGAIDIIANTLITSGIVEYNYPASYPTLISPSTDYQSYVWVIGGTQYITSSPQYRFVPWNSPVEYNVTVVLYGVKYVSGSPQNTYLYRYNLTVYPALNVQVSSSKNSVVITEMMFTVSFNQPLPSNSTVVLDLSYFNAGTVNLYPVSGTGGYTWQGSAFLPFTQVQSGMVSVPLKVHYYVPGKGWVDATFTISVNFVRNN